MLVTSSSQGKFYTKNFKKSSLYNFFVAIFLKIIILESNYTVVVQGLCDEFILEFMWLVICIYALGKIADLLGTVVLQYG